ILKDGEFIWADSAYPIQTWVVAPHKMPEWEEPDNQVFNNHVSMFHIQSEHAIGYLKGHFHSLKGIHVNI
ncbi:hypothetical protein P692DRAFT_20744198, partial [Suillus brevipes Sb2]